MKTNSFRNDEKKETLLSTFIFLCTPNMNVRCWVNKYLLDNRDYLLLVEDSSFVLPSTISS